MTDSKSSKDKGRVRSASREAPTKIMETRQAPTKPVDIRSKKSTNSTNSEN